MYTIDTREHPTINRNQTGTCRLECHHDHIRALVLTTVTKAYTIALYLNYCCMRRILERSEPFILKLWLNESPVTTYAVIDGGSGSGGSVNSDDIDGKRV
uniref:Uncharacterized protein n=1 Tax=Glossina palpalis gambiensis TaxID=67801 RepID=A0A1B0AUE4_9MUSC